MQDLPLDVKVQWLNVIRRLQSACSENHGIAIISISILIDECGNPKFWTEPKMIKLEPKGSKHELLELINRSLGLR